MLAKGAAALDSGWRCCVNTGLDITVARGCRCIGLWLLMPQDTGLDGRARQQQYNVLWLAMEWISLWPMIADAIYYGW